MNKDNGITVSKEGGRWVVRGADGVRRGSFNSHAAARKWVDELLAKHAAIGLRRVE